MRAPGLAIHVRRGAGYRQEGESRAFPGWKAQEIRLALTEAPMSETAWRALERTALAMGTREGTKPRRRSPHAFPEREGHGRKAMRKAMGRVARKVTGKAMRKATWTLWQISSHPGDRADRGDDEAPGAVQRSSGTVVVAAALACTDEADFRRRIREQRDLRAANPSYPDPGE